VTRAYVPSPCVGCPVADRCSRLWRERLDRGRRTGREVPILTMPEACAVWRECCVGQGCYSYRCVISPAFPCQQLSLDLAG
jgi:hypothetical protein